MTDVGIETRSPGPHSRAGATKHSLNSSVSYFLSKFSAYEIDSLKDQSAQLNHRTGTSLALAEHIFPTLSQ